MQRKRKGTGIIIIIFALVAMLTTEWLSNVSRKSSLRNPTQILSTGNLDAEKHAAFLAARASVLTDLVSPREAVWAPESQAGFQETPTENYIALQVEVTNSPGKRVREHWIVGLERGTNVVRSKVCKEHAGTIGTPSK